MRKVVYGFAGALLMGLSSGHAIPAVAAESPNYTAREVRIGATMLRVPVPGDLVLATKEHGEYWDRLQVGYPNATEVVSWITRADAEALRANQHTPLSSWCILPLEAPLRPRFTPGQMRELADVIREEGVRLAAESLEGIRREGPAFAQAAEPFSVQDPHLVEDDRVAYSTVGSENGERLDATNTFMALNGRMITLFCYVRGGSTADARRLSDRMVGLILEANVGGR